MKKLYIFVVAAFFLLFSNTGSAVSINGDFETGNLSGWYTSGPVTVDVVLDGINHYAEIETGYDPVTGQYITALEQDFFIPNDPLPLTFDFYFETTGPDPSAWWIDALTVSLETNMGDLFDFLIVDDYWGISLNPLATITDSSVFSDGYTLALDVTGYAGAEATLSFWLWDEDDLADSRVLIDNVSANPVPEPGTILLLACGLFVLLGLRRQFM